MLAEQRALFGVQAAQKHLSLDVRVDPKVPRRVAGDADRLRQVLVNLVGNALKFTEHGGVTVTAAVVRSAENRVDLEFVVKDTGIGVPPEKRAAIFEAFTQADGSISRRYGGSGLGLAISARVVQAMHGRIWLEPGEECGSVFHLVVPFVTVKEAPAPADRVANETEPQGPAASSPARILLAEDSLVNQRLATVLLARRGYRVLVASNGREALGILERDPVDLVLMDVQMPEVDGLEATRAIRLREEASGGHVPIVAMTAHAMAGDRERCLAAGMDDYVSKPIESAALYAVVGRLLDARHAMTLAAGQPGSEATDLPMAARPA
jgi:CheY-like chemotaxis protein/SHS2 domain-containing protein